MQQEISLAGGLARQFLISLCTVLAASQAAGQYSCINGMCEQVPWRPVTNAPKRILVGQPTSSVHPAICRVVNTVGRAANVGSGTLVAADGNRGLVLTCGHLFHDGRGSIVVEFSSGRRYQARLVDMDQANDLAMLAIATPGTTPIENDPTTPGGRLSACGYGPDGRFACAQGSLVGYATPLGATHPSMKISGAVRAGDSGGAVINGQGRLVGVIWGVRDGVTYATFGQPLRQFLQSLRISGGQSTPTSPDPAPFDSQSLTDFSELSDSMDQLDRRVATLEDRIKTWPSFDGIVTRQELGGFARREDLGRFATTNQLTDIDNRATAGRASILAQVKAEVGNTAQAAKAAAVAVVRERISERVGLFEGLSAGKLLAGALGISGPLGLAVVVGSSIVGRRVKRRLRRGASRVVPDPDAGGGGGPPNSYSSKSPKPVAVDTPPPPQRTVPETHYVPYERDEFARAFQWASEQVARKYPGSIETLTTLNSLIKQQVNASRE